MRKSRFLVPLAFILLISGVFFVSSTETKLMIKRSLSLDSLFFDKVKPEVKRIIEEQSKISIVEKKEILENAYLDLKLSEFNQTNIDSLNILEAGLRSKDLEERLKSAHLIRNLVVKLADNQFQIDSEYQDQVNNLIRLFETNGKEEIKEVSDANPESKTLAYIKSIKE